MKNLSIKKKVIIGLIVVFTLGVLATNLVLFVRFMAQIEEMIVDKARSITIMGEAIREYQSDNWERGVFQREYLQEDVKGRFVYSVPVFSSIITMDKKAKELGYSFKVPKVSPRNPKNEPDAFERTVLTELEKKQKKEFVHINWGEEKIDYYRAIELSKECLDCHGDPATSEALWSNAEGKDPTGAKMENWKAGEVHGAFKLTYDLKTQIAENRKIKAITIIINLIIIVVAALVIRRVVKKALDPLDRIAISLEEINRGAGDLSKKIDIISKDEVGKVAMLFNSFIDQLRTIVVAISDSASHVSSSSEEMTAASQNLANVAQDQAASIEETSSAMEQIKATIDSVSENAKNQASKANTTFASMSYLAGEIDAINRKAQNANGMAEETHRYAEEGEQVLSSTVDGMKDIASSSRQITEIVSIISDITDQINLLSLNASIEAARAGDQGRGFAVVAEEIAKLAEQTAHSSKQINDLIIQTNKKVDSGVKLVEKTADSLRRIIENVRKSAEIMEGIARSSVELNSRSISVKEEVVGVNRMSEEISVMMEEQSLSSNEIIKAIDSINSVTQQVASGSEELAAGSEELAGQAEVLNEIVQRFKL